METLFGIIIGFISSWIISHYYYKRQSREQINPIPYIQEVNHAVVELYGLAIDRNDEELLTKLKKVARAVTASRIRVLEFLTPIAGNLMLMAEVVAEANDSKTLEWVKKKAPQFEAMADRLVTIKYEYSALRQFLDETAGTSVHEDLTVAELIKIEFNSIPPAKND